MRKNSLPLVSVIITTYNREKTLSRALSSVLSQTYANLEIIISDNSSTDGTLNVATKFQIKDNRIKIFFHEYNIGMAKNYLSASQQANGKYITFLSSDDEFYNENFIHTSVMHLENHVNAGLSHAINIIHDNVLNTFSLDSSYLRARSLYSSSPINGKMVFLLFSLFNLVSFGGTVFNTALFKRYFYPSPGIYSFDVQIILRLLLVSDIIFLPQKSYIFHVSNISLTSNPRSTRLYIRNLRYIEDPYHSAIKLHAFNFPILYLWRSLILADFSSNVLVLSFLHPSKSLRLFHAYLLRRHSLSCPFIYLRVAQRLCCRRLSLSIKYIFGLANAL